MARQDELIADGEAISAHDVFGLKRDPERANETVRKLDRRLDDRLPRPGENMAFECRSADMIGCRFQFAARITPANSSISPAGGIAITKCVSSPFARNRDAGTPPW